MHDNKSKPLRFNASPRVVFAVVTVAIAVIVSFHISVGWVPILDSVNLVFHEAGHPIFGLLGGTPALYGGTLGQLVFPTVVTVSFWRRGEQLGAALGGVWLFENGFNIARYIADARARELPLVGGGDHDWFNILLRWDALHSDTSIAKFVVFLSAVGLLAIWVRVTWRWLFPPND